MTEFIEYRKYIIAFALASLLGICTICNLSFKMISGPLWEVVVFDIIVAAFGLCCICLGASANKGHQMLRDDGHEID
jgi:hypothetical protein